MGEAMPAFTVQINCGSGMQSIDTAYKYIRDGSADLILAGGAEALSHSPLLLQQNAVHWLADFQRAKSLGQRLKSIMRFRPWDFKPVIMLFKRCPKLLKSIMTGLKSQVRKRIMLFKRCIMRFRPC